MKKKHEVLLQKFRAEISELKQLAAAEQQAEARLAELETSGAPWEDAWRQLENARVNRAIATERLDEKIQAQYALAFWRAVKRQLLRPGRA